jgi:hypothetical protein
MQADFVVPVETNRFTGDFTRYDHWLQKCALQGFISVAREWPPFPGCHNLQSQSNSASLCGMWDFWQFLALILLFSYNSAVNKTGRFSRNLLDYVMYSFMDPQYLLSVKNPMELELFDEVHSAKNNLFSINTFVGMESFLAIFRA